MKADIASIQVENFQSHEDTVFRPAPGGYVTAILGATHSGKTALIRAWRWVAYNEPQGDEFTRHGAAFARVTIELANGVKVTRYRSASKNQYILALGENDVQVLEGFGSVVPQEVQDILGVRVSDIAGTQLRLNYGSQLEPPFLGADAVSGTTRARILGYLAGTDAMDAAQKNLHTDQYRANAELKRCQETAAQIESQLAEYTWLPDALERIQKAAELTCKAEELHDKALRIEAALRTFKDIAVRRLEIRLAIERGRRAEAALEHVAQGEQNLTMTTQIRDTVVQLLKVRADRNVCKLTIRKGLVAEATLAKIEPVGASIDRYNDIRETVARLLMVRQQREQNAVTLRRCAVDIDGALYRLQPVGELLATHAAMSRAISRLTDIRESRVRYQPVIAAGIAAQAVMDRLLPGVENLVTRVEKLRRIAQMRREAAESIGRTRQSIDTLAARIAEAETQYIETLREAGICPTCGQPIPCEEENR